MIDAKQADHRKPHVFLTILLFLEVGGIQLRSTFDETIFGSISDGFGGQIWVTLAPKIDQKSMLKFDRFSDAFWEGLWAA